MIELDAETITDVITALEWVRLDPFPAFGSYSDESYGRLKRMILFCEQLKLELLDLEPDLEPELE